MDDGTCPVCAEDLDPTDYLLASRLCRCRYSVCLWCYRRLTEDAAKDGRPALCPNCREPYDTERIAREGRELNPQQLEEVKRKKGKQEEKRKPVASTRPRKDLANVRVVQRNLVYVVGLPMELCYEELLSSTEYIGQYGKIVKISVSRTGPYGALAAKNGPTGSAYITFRRNDDARRCIESIHGTYWEGKLVKACYGTTKYCNAFLKGLPCNNAECLYLHDVAVEEDSYTKEETKSTKFVNLVHAASLNQASAVASGQPHATTLAEFNAAFPGFDGNQQLTEPLSSLDEEAPEGGTWPTLAKAWSAKSPAAAATAPSMPLADDPQAWPGLPGGQGSSNVTGNNSSAETSENESEAAVGKLSKAGPTMADQIARARAGTPASQKEESKKRLTNLNGWSKAGGEGSDALEGKHREIQSQEPGHFSPPRTPQLISKPGRSSLDGQKGGSKVYQQLQATGESLGTKHSESQDAELSAAAGSQPPPGFAAPAAARGKVVQPPPGFTHVSYDPLNHSVNPLGQLGLNLSSTVQQQQPPLDPLARSGPADSLQGIWSSTQDAGFQRPLGFDSGRPAQPRARSRFQFANEQSSPNSEAPASLFSEQPATPEPGYLADGGFLFGKGLPDGHALGVQGVTSSPLWADLGAQVGEGNLIGQAVTQQQKSSGGEEPLPAGLALLRKLQAQGGITRRSMSGNSATGQQHPVFQDPAILSATPSPEYAVPERAWLDSFGASRQEVPPSAGTESQAHPKTPPRRRKGKGT